MYIRNSASNQILLGPTSTWFDLAHQPSLGVRSFRLLGRGGGIGVAPQLEPPQKKKKNPGRAAEGAQF